MVVDLDAHHGNGTALCFPSPAEPVRAPASRPARSVFLFDMYQQGIYPIPKEREDASIPLPEGIDDGRYLEILRDRLGPAMDEFRPELVIFQAGCDVLKGDALAGLSLTPAGLRLRDLYVIDQCVRRRVPVAMVLGGGYGPDSWLAQCGSIRAILDLYATGRRYSPRSATTEEKLYTK
jgi:acetoin utilization deacetylase AcuC-like enzyme